MTSLEVLVTAGGPGPVLRLSGEADVTTVARLQAALDEQIAAGARFLTVDLSRLRFADSASIHVLARAGRALSDQGGRLELVDPQPVVARTLSLLGVDRILTVRGRSGGPGQDVA